MADAPKLQGTEKIGESYYKINMGIDNANEALKKSYEAGTISNNAVNIANGAVNTSNSAVESATVAKQKAQNVQDQLDQIVIEGDSSVEAAQARPDENGNSHSSLKDRLDTQFTNIAVNISNYGVLGDGTNESAKILNAFTMSRARNKILELNPKGVYVLQSSSDVYIPTIKGNGATIRLKGNFALRIYDNFVASDLNIETENVYPNTSSTLTPIFRGDNAKNILFNNLNFKAIGGMEDGSKRATIAIKLNSVENASFKNISGDCFARGIVVEGKSKGLLYDNITFTNTEQMLYCTGSKPDSTEKIYVEDITFRNITHTNTKVQSENYIIHKGADTILLEKCKHITFENIVSTYASERVIYMSVCYDVTGSNIRMYESWGIKFSGILRYDLQINNVSDQCQLNNISMTTKVRPEGYLVEIYNAKNVKVDNGVFFGNGIGDSVIKTQRYVENVEFNNVTGYDLKRSIFEYAHWGDIPGVPEVGVPPLLEKDYLRLINTLSFNNVKGYNIGIVGYEAIRFVNYGSPMPTDSYCFKNLKYNNIKIDNTKGNYDVVGEVTGTANTTNCSGLTNINDVVNLRIDSCEVKGYKGTQINGAPVQIPIQIGSNSLDVIVNHTEIVRNTGKNKYNLGSLFLSSGSKLIFKSVERIYGLDEEIAVTPQPNANSVTSTTDVTKKFNMSGRISIRTTGNDAINIVGFDNAAFTLPEMIGRLEVFDSIGNYALYTISKSIIQKKSGDDKFTTTITDGKIALIKDSSLPRFILRDKTATTGDLIINYSLSVA
ncbi:hypothetical protein ACQGS7_12695 [Bacillus sp. GFa4/2]|uniref:hypothetical protein n=1 Tax=Bacillus sp. GFa4/2 TaxID=3418495 RepID=UPI003CEAF7B7